MLTLKKISTYIIYYR